MLSADDGSLMIRYRSAFWSAAGILLFRDPLDLVLIRHASSLLLNSFSSSAERIVELVHDSLLERDDRVVRDGDVLRADLGAALGDVAQADAVLLPQVRDPVFGVERVHLERRDVHQEPRADELVVHAMLPQDVADVLTQEALDALPVLLHPVDVGLIHPPGPVGSIGRARLERLDPSLDPEVPRDVGHEILDRRERAHRLDGHRLVERQLVQAGSCT